MPTGEIAGPVIELRRSLIAAVAGLCLAGCSAGDVEFQGKLFELAGLNNIGKKGDAPEISERTGLVVPPDLSKLPDPDKPAVINHSETALDLINDPDRARVVDEAELQRRQEVACKDYEFAKMRGDESGALTMEGPLGPCRKSALTNVGGWMNSK
ncbi:MAG: hypothetical protein KJ587_05315 [Alphaproteobacteria bacterium]|nr:hypothetical protein [Alphaproteobacteria bacterium]